MNKYVGQDSTPGQLVTSPSSMDSSLNAQLLS